MEKFGLLGSSMKKFETSQIQQMWGVLSNRTWKIICYEEIFKWTIRFTQGDKKITDTGVVIETSIDQPGIIKKRVGLWYNGKAKHNTEILFQQEKLKL